MQKRWECCRRPLATSVYRKKNVYKWYKQFREGREDVEKHVVSKRPKSSTDEEHVKEIKELVLANHPMTTRDIVDIVGISYGSILKILKDELDLKRIKSRLVPKSLNFFKKECRINICQTTISDYEPVIQRIITGDETWIYASIIVVWCIMNSFRRAKLLIRNIIWVLCVICVKLFAKRGRYCGEKTLGFCIMIMPYLTLVWFCETFLQNIPLISFRNHPIRLI